MTNILQIDRIPPATTNSPRAGVPNRRATDRRASAPKQRGGSENRVTKSVSQKLVVSKPRVMPIRGLNQNVAAEYIGVSPSKFDEMVQDGRMPPPKKIDRRRVWDIHQLDSAFDKLPCDVDEDRNSWDEILQMTTGRSNGPH